MQEIYLDAAATTRPAPEAVAAMLPFLRERFGNASSLHRRGVESARALEDARIEVARAIDREKDEVVFTSGATEANNLALLGAAAAQKRRGDHIVATSVEHPSVLEPLRALEKDGFKVSLAPVEKDGSLDPERVLSIINDGTVLLSVMHVQNETGAIFPIDALAARARAKRPGILVHSDGAQALGKVAPPSRAIDLYTVSGHKAHGPLGAGALAISKGVRVLPLLHGGGQERKLRSGTENLPAIVGFGVAAKLARERLGERTKKARVIRERLESALRDLGAVFNSPPGSVATTLNASFPGNAAEPLLHALEQRGVLVSSGSACSTRKPGSHVLDAMGLADEVKKSSLRFSFSPDDTQPEDVERALLVLRELLHGSLARPLR